MTDHYARSLRTAQELFRQGNLPQAENYLRECEALAGMTPEVADLLAGLRRGYGISEAFELSERALPILDRSERFLLIKAWGYGFWSEVHHLLSQLLLAELTQRTPIVLWGKNCLFRNADDVNAFCHFFEEISTIKPEDVASSETIYPTKWSSSNLYEEDMNKWEGKESRMAAQYLLDRPETLLVSDFFSTLSSIIPWIGRNSGYFGLSEDELYARLTRKYLKPADRIQVKVSEFFARNMQGRPWVAVHVRGSDKINESAHLARTNKTYFGFIDRILELNPGIGIFLLTDSLMVVSDFKQRYGTSVLFTPARRSDTDVGVHYSGGDGVATGIEVLLDTLLAVKCDYFVGNQESNVSAAIASMRDWPQGFVFLLGAKNIRTDKLFLHNRTRDEERPAELSSKKTKNYQIGKYRVVMPFDHKLDEFQRLWRRYDQPIVDICSSMLRAQEGITVIDIGANIADTAAAICRTPNVQVLAIEGNPTFLPYLRYNAHSIGSAVTIEACFIGNSGDNVFVRPGTNLGTASVARASSGIEPSFRVKSIEEITAKHPSFSNPDLVKIDTDGSDFSILTAMKSWLHSKLPSLYFEFDPSFSATGVTDGLKAIDQLTEIGYEHFFVFDNFGNPLCEIEGKYRRRFAELCNWLASNRKFGTAVWYLDVLALTSSELPWLDDFRASHSSISTDQFSPYMQRMATLTRLRRSGMRIAIDGVFFRFSTGISRLWRSLLAEWSANGFGEFLVVIDRAKTAPRYAGISYVDAPQHNYADCLADRKMLQEICDREKITLFISTYYTTPLATRSALMVPDMIPEVIGYDLGNEQWQEKHHAIRYCRNYLSISESTANDLIRFFPEISPEQVTTAYCGTGFRTPCAEQINSFKQRYGIDRPYFMISGVKHGYKNALLFFQAFARLGESRSAYSIICTNSPPSLEPEFLECVGAAKVYLLVLPDEELQCAYAGALALAYPSRYEGFGLPVLEAMACSCPVITCNNSSIGEVGGDAVIYVDPDSPDEMSLALQAVQVEATRSKLIGKGLLRARKFTWRKMADQVESALERWSGEVAA